MTDNISVERVRFSVNPDILDGVNRLLLQLHPTGQGEKITKQELYRCFSNPDFHLVAAKDSSRPYPENFVGMGSIFFQRNLERWIAEIHDVVVDLNYRGQGIGRKIILGLINIAKERAKKIGKEFKLYLTSRPSRVEANKMYVRLGFVLAAKAKREWGTNLYKMIIAP